MDDAESLQQAYQFAMQGKLNDAFERATALLSQSPRDPKVWHFFAWLQSERGCYQDAIDKITKALELKPNDPEILANMVDIYDKADFIQQALVACEKLVALKPDESQYQLSLANLYLIVGESDKAMSILEHLIGKDCNAVDLHFTFSLAHYKQGDYKAAFAGFKKCLSLDENNGRAEAGMRLSWLAYNFSHLNKDSLTNGDNSGFRL